MASNPSAPSIVGDVSKCPGTEFVVEWDRHLSVVLLVGLVFIDQLRMKVPRKRELPFFDSERHDNLSSEELRTQADAMRQYRENLKATSREKDESR